jgi:hypothetical protein
LESIPGKKSFHPMRIFGEFYGMLKEICNEGVNDGNENMGTQRLHHLPAGVWSDASAIDKNGEHRQGSL